MLLYSNIKLNSSNMLATVRKKDDKIKIIEPKVIQERAPKVVNLAPQL